MIAKSGRVVSPTFQSSSPEGLSAPHQVNKINMQAETFVFKNSVVFTFSYNNIRISLQNS